MYDAPQSSGEAFKKGREADEGLLSRCRRDAHEARGQEIKIHKVYKGFRHSPFE